MSRFASTTSTRRLTILNRPSLGPFSQVGLVTSAVLFVYVVTISGAGAVLGGAAIGATIVLIIWRWPIVGLLALVVLGPPHQFLMVLVLHFTGSAAILKIVQLWKDIFVIVLIARAIDQAFRRKRSPTLYLLDLGILIFLAMGALYVPFPSQAGEVSLYSKLLGLRADSFFLVAYFVGRGLELSAGQIKALLIGFAGISLIIAVVAAAQFVAPNATNLVFNLLGLAEFTALAQGQGAASFAVRENDFSGFVIPRASSLVLSDLALGFYTLLAAPMMAGFLLHFPRLRDKIVGNLLVLAVIGTTCLTVTRSAIIALVPVLGAVFLRARGVFYVVLLLVELIFAVTPVAYSLKITPSVLQVVFSPNGGSVQGHLRSINDSLVILRQQPLGRGLGTSGQVAQVTDVQGGITNEDWYLQIATEIGIVPAAVFALIVIGFGLTAFARYGQVRDPWLKTLCLGMAGATIGFGLVGITLHVWEAETISIVFWLFAGIVVRAQSIEPEGGVDAHRGMA